MIGCCAFLPVGLLMIIMPILSAGRGFRALLTTVVMEFAVVAVIVLMNLGTLVDAAEHWRTDGLVIMPFMVLMVFPIGMAGLVLYVKKKEQEYPLKVCRVCGYDLRASPQRCPECGTPVRHDPERF